MTTTNELKKYNWKNWDEIKIYAYSAAKKSVENNHSKEEMQNKYFDCFVPESIVWMANDLAGLYYSFMTKELSNDVAGKKAKELQEKYNNVMQIFMDDSEAFEAIEKAFHEADMEYGTVTFICPYCGAKVTATREASSNERHKINTNSSCPNKCFEIIN